MDPCRPLATPSAQRVIDRVRVALREDPNAELWCLRLLDELNRDESLASAVLSRLGWPADETHGEDREPDCSIAETIAGFEPTEFVTVLNRAAFIARRRMSDVGASTEDLLLALVECNDDVRNELQRGGLDPDVVHRAITGESEPDRDSSTEQGVELNFDDEGSLPDAAGQRGSSLRMIDDSHAALRIIDANLNRAREGLRVLDDFARFALNDHRLCAELKELRHALIELESFLRDDTERLTMRDTVHDVGTSITLHGEASRGSLLDVIRSNNRRVQEALRSVEEFGKLWSAAFAESAKQLRYRLYSLEQSLIVGRAPGAPGLPSRAVAFRDCRQRRRELLAAARVYVLVTEAQCRLPWQTAVREVLNAGAGVVQLREKSLSDRELIQRARWLVNECREAGALAIINDRADVAAAAEADGVHVGQDELSVAEVRRVLSPDQLVGVSTHDPQQAATAVDNGAEYLGVGPVFASPTKHFEKFAGLDFVKSCAAEVSLPWFAIGGITMETLDAVISAGTSRIAVSSVVLASVHPGDVVRELHARLVCD